MPRRLRRAALYNSPAGAAILPDQLAPKHRVSTEPVQGAANREVWDEFGLQAAERADYAALRVTAYRFKDSTGAYAARQWLLASDASAITFGNYAITCAGKCPPAARLTDWLAANPPPNLLHSSYPTLEASLPRTHLFPRSTLYLLAPLSLSPFHPILPT